MKQKKTIVILSAILCTALFLGTIAVIDNAATQKENKHLKQEINNLEINLEYEKSLNEL